MCAALLSVEGPLFKSLDLSEMSVPSDTSYIAVSPTINMMASIFALICISIIFYEIIKYKNGAQGQLHGAPSGHEAQDYPKMHLPHQAQELTTSSSTGARGLGRSSRNHKARCAGGRRSRAEGGLDGAGLHTTTTSSAASSSTSTSGRTETA